MSKRKRSPAPDPLFVDTSGFIALLSADDRNHRAADALFRKAIGQGLVLTTTNLILAETHRLILFRAGIRPARVAIDRITQSSHIALHAATETDHLAALAWLDRLSDQRITYTDAVSFAVMQVLRHRRVISFDHDFVIAGFELAHPTRPQRGK